MARARRRERCRSRTCWWGSGRRRRRASGARISHRPVELHVVAPPSTYWGSYGTFCHDSAVRNGTKSANVVSSGHAQFSRSTLLGHDSAGIVPLHAAATAGAPGRLQQNSWPVSGQAANVPESQKASPKCSCGATVSGRSAGTGTHAQAGPMWASSPAPARGQPGAAV